MSARTFSFAVLAAALAGGCAPTAQAPSAGDMAGAPLQVTAVPRELVAQDLVLAEWAKAENRERCAPLAFASVGRGGWSARRAEFSGGWAVAFDMPGTRSAFGVAGTGSLPEDQTSQAAQRSALRQQWPYFLELPALSGFAGYGLEGAEPYSSGDPDSAGRNSLAYVRVDGQQCLYNVWSRLGRAHLEILLDQLRLVRPRD